MGVWYHDERAGLVKEEGKEGYICRGFRREHGNLLAAAPVLKAACEAILEQLPALWGDHVHDGKITVTIDATVVDMIEDAVLKADEEKAS